MVGRPKGEMWAGRGEGSGQGQGKGVEIYRGIVRAEESGSRRRENTLKSGTSTAAFVMVVKRYLAIPSVMNIWFVCL